MKILSWLRLPRHMRLQNSVPAGISNTETETGVISVLVNSVPPHCSPLCFFKHCVRTGVFSILVSIGAPQDLAAGKVPKSMTLKVWFVNWGQSRSHEFILLYFLPCHLLPFLPTLFTPFPFFLFSLSLRCEAASSKSSYEITVKLHQRGLKISLRGGASPDGPHCIPELVTLTR